MKNTAVLLLVVFILAFLIFATANYSYLVHSDPGTYLDFAKGLSAGSIFLDYAPENILKEKLPPDRYHKGFYTRIIKDDRSFPFVAIGYPLFLTPFLLAGGTFAPFAANTIVFIGFFIVLYKLSVVIFKQHEFGRYISVLAVLLYFLINIEQIVYLLKCYRDPLSYLYMLFGFWFYFKFLNQPNGVKFLIPAAFFIGLSCTVRETSVLCVFPMGLIYLVKLLRRKIRVGLLFKHGVIVTLFFALGISILLAQNYVCSGNPLQPVQGLREKVMKPEKDKANTMMPGMGLHNFQRSSVSYLRRLWKKFGWLFTGLFAVGIIVGRKRDEVVFFLLPFTIIYFLFYSFYVSTPWRYMFVIQMTVVPVIALGAVELVRKIQSKFLKPDKTVMVTGGLLLLLGFVIFIMYGAEFEKPFQSQQARQFKNDFDQAVPKSSIVIAERVMRQNIDYFTDSFCFRFDDFVRPEYGITERSGLDYFLSNFENVFFFDNADLGLQHKFNYTPISTQSVLDYFNLVPYKQFRSEDYRLEEYFGEEYCTLSRIERWRDNEVEQSLGVAQAEESILIINARKLWNNGFERKEALLYLDDTLLGDSITDGLNYFYVPREKLEQGECTIKLVSDAPVPADLEPVLLNVYDEIRLNCGATFTPLDSYFLSDDFMENRPGLSLRRRAISTGGTVIIPTVVLPDSTLVVVYRAKLTSESDGLLCQIRFSLNGKLQAKQVIRISNSDQIFGFPLQRSDIGGNVSQLTLDVQIEAGKCDTGIVDDAYLAVDKFVVMRYDHGLEKVVIDFGINDLMFVYSGFYHNEYHLGKHPVRWTSAEAKINLPFIEPAEIGAVGLVAWGRPEAAGEAISQLFINDKFIGEFRVVPERRQKVILEIPSGILVRGKNVMVLKSTTWRPADVFDVTDKRELGFMIDSIKLMSGIDNR